MTPDRDHQVQQMVREGRSTCEIARALGVSPMQAEVLVQLAMADLHRMRWSMTTTGWPPLA